MCAHKRSRATSSKSTLAHFLTRPKTDPDSPSRSGKTRVVALRRCGGRILQDCDVYIGRTCSQGGWALPQSKWHNPFSVQRCGSVDKAVAQFRTYLLKQPALMADLGSLRGKVLGCWCKKPKTPHSACHGDVLAELADALPVADTDPKVHSLPGVEPGSQPEEQKAT